MKLTFGQIWKLAYEEPRGKKALLSSLFFLVICVIVSIFFGKTTYGNAIVMATALAFSFQFQSFLKVFVAIQHAYDADDDSMLL